MIHVRGSSAIAGAPAASAPRNVGSSPTAAEAAAAAGGGRGKRMRRSSVRCGQRGPALESNQVRLLVVLHSRQQPPLGSSSSLSSSWRTRPSSPPSSSPSPTVLSRHQANLSHFLLPRGRGCLTTTKSPPSPPHWSNHVPLG